MRSPIIHGVLLVAMLGIAYQTWTREKKVEPKTGSVSVWNEDASKMTALVFETKNRTLRIERRGTGADAHFWGKEIRTRKVRKAVPKPVVTDKDAGPSKPKPPEFEEKITTREFPVGNAGEKLVKDFSKLRALRDLGKVSDSDRKDYKLENSIDNVTVSFEGNKTHSLVMGGRVHGTGNRYFVDAESGKGYVLAGPLVSPLSAGETTLTLKTLHAYKPVEEKKATIKVGGKERKLVSLTTEVGKGKVKRKRKTWADAATPTKPNQTMANVLDHIGKLKPAQYMKDKKTDDLELLAEVDYFDGAGKKIGFVKMYREAPEAEKKDPALPTDGAKKDGADAPKPVPAKVVPAKPAPTKTAPAKPVPAKAVPRKTVPAKKVTAPKPAATPEKEVAGSEEAEQATPAGKPVAKPAVRKPPVRKPPVKRPPVKRSVVKHADRQPAMNAKMRKQIQDKFRAAQAKQKAGGKMPPGLRKPRKRAPRKPQAKYYIMTERTRVLGLLRRPAAERVAQDLKQLFSGE